MIPREVMEADGELSLTAVTVTVNLIAAKTGDLRREVQLIPFGGTPHICTCDGHVLGSL